MPVLGEIKRGKELGKEDYRKYIWDTCPKCGKGRWLVIRNKGNFCHKCSAPCGKDSWSWKGHKLIDAAGYMRLPLERDDFFYPMTSEGYIKEHRLIMAKSLGRNLHAWEIVHHKNGIKTDNRIENLQLTSDMGHKQITIFESRIKYLEDRIRYLEVILKNNNLLSS